MLRTKQHVVKKTEQEWMQMEATIGGHEQRLESNFILTHQSRYRYNCTGKLFDSGLSCYKTKYWSKDTAFRKLDLMEFDDNGWAVIHHMVAADKPLLNQVRIFCDADKNLLSLQTRDQFKYTPLLLACHSGKADSVRCLIELGADLAQRDSNGYTALHVSALRENEQCMRALLDTNKTQWKEMINIISRGKNDEVEALADQLKKLFEDGAGPKEKLRTLFVEKFDGLEAIKTSLSDQRRSNERAIALIDLLITIFEVKGDYQEQFVSIGGIPVITDILKTAGSLEVSGYGFDCLNIMAQTNVEWAYVMFQNGLTENIISALTRNDAVTLPLLTGAITLLAKMLRSNEAVPASIGDQSDIFGLLANCFDMVNADDLAEGAYLTTSLLSVFDALLSLTKIRLVSPKFPRLYAPF